MSSIVYVDDQAEDLLAMMDEQQRACITPFQDQPEEGFPGAFEEAKRANTWVFDFFFKEQDVDNPNNLAENGLSLFHKWRRSAGDARPPTAVISGHLERAIGPLEPPGRHHIHAKRLGVEWIGDKTDPLVGAKLVALSRASASIAEAVQPCAAALDGAHQNGLQGSALSLQTLCDKVLRLPSNIDWTSTAQRHVDHARPPRILPLPAGFGASRLILSWLLQNVLPYPTFLISDAQAAVRLHVTLATFRNLVVAIDDTIPLLSQALYRGPVSELVGRRWWRGGIDHLAWVLQESNLGYQEALFDLFATGDIEFLQHADPVVLFDADLVETEEVVASATCFRAIDEHLPPNVNPVWVSKEDVGENRELRAKVVVEDIRLVDEDN